MRATLHIHWAFALIALLAGCSGGDESSAMSTNGEPPASAEVPICADMGWAAASEVFSGSTDEAMDSVGPAPCVSRGTNGSADVVVHFATPVAGRYTFSTQGSGFDTVLHLRQAVCDGEVLACNDDYGGSASQITIDLEAGQGVLAVVDGFNREKGEVELSVLRAETECSDELDNDGDGGADCDDADCFLFCEAPDDWPADWAQLEEEALVETNRARSQPTNCADESFGAAPPLTMNLFARYAARLHSRAMGREAFFEHDSPDGRTFSDRMRQAGFMGALPWAENIAAGQDTAAEVVQTWVDSPGHCKNLMNPEFTVIGIGYAEVPGTEFDQYWTQDFAAGE